MPKIEIVAIGDEVLQGAVVNTNAARIAQMLNEIGLEVNSHVVVGDNHEEIKEVILFSVEHFDITILTGGLGPTCDDITKSVLVSVYETRLKTDPKTLESLKSRYPDMDNIVRENQSMVPKDCIVLDNNLGSAPGLMLISKGSLLFSLPGVPREVEHIMENKVISIIQDKFNIKTSIMYRNLHFAKMPETEISQEINFIKGRYPEIKIGIYPHSGVLSVHLRLNASPSSFEVKCLNDAAEYLKSNHINNFFSEDTYELPKLINKLCESKSITMSLVQDLINIPLGLKISGAEGGKALISNMSLSSKALAKRFRVKKDTSIDEAAIIIAKHSKVMFSSDIGISVIHESNLDLSKDITYCFFYDTDKHYTASIPKRHQPESKNKLSIISNFILFDLHNFLKYNFKDSSE